MKVARRKLASAIAAKTLKSGSSRRFGREVAAYLLSEHRSKELDSLLRDVQAAWTESGYVEVLASSAYGLTPQIKSQIKVQIKRLYPQAKQIIITEVHDPQVIGGVRLSLANRQLDLSLVAKLHKFKQLTGAGKE